MCKDGEVTGTRESANFDIYTAGDDMMSPIKILWMTQKNKIFLESQQKKLKN